MSTLRASPTHITVSGVAGSIAAFNREAVAFLRAIVSPGRIIREVEQMHALQVEAARIEATEPARAASLRRQAAALGLN